MWKSGMGGPDWAGAARTAQQSAIADRSCMWCSCSQATTTPRLPSSILRGPFHVIDHQDLDGPFGRFQAKAELLLNSRKQRRSEGALCGLAIGWWPHVRRPLQLEIVFAFQA